MFGTLLRCTMSLVALITTVRRSCSDDPESEAGSVAGDGLPEVITDGYVPRYFKIRPSSPEIAAGMVQT